MSDDKEIRRGTRLESDDPKHCKKCGAEIPHVDDYTDKYGRPIAWVSGDWVALERCHDCWAKDQLRQLRFECMERYNGHSSEVLDE
jgi:predicted amidophosphoribosyltransferase